MNSILQFVVFAIFGFALPSILSYGGNGDIPTSPSVYVVCALTGGLIGSLHALVVRVLCWRDFAAPIPTPFRKVTKLLLVPMGIGAVLFTCGIVCLTQVADYADLVLSPLVLICSGFVIFFAAAMVGGALGLVIDIRRLYRKLSHGTAEP